MTLMTVESVTVTLTVTLAVTLAGYLAVLNTRRLSQFSAQPPGARIALLSST